MEREGRHGILHVDLVTVLRPDCADRASEESLIGLLNGPMIGRLSRDRGKTTDFFKACRGQLPAGIAINASRIDKKVTCDIGVESFFLIGHGTPLCQTYRIRKTPVCAQSSL